MTLRIQSSALIYFSFILLFIACDTVTPIDPIENYRDASNQGSYIPPRIRLLGEMETSLDNGAFDIFWLFDNNGHTEIDAEEETIQLYCRANYGIDGSRDEYWTPWSKGLNNITLYPDETFAHETFGFTIESSYFSNPSDNQVERYDVSGLIANQFQDIPAIVIRPAHIFTATTETIEFEVRIDNVGADWTAASLQLNIPVASLSVIDVFSVHGGIVQTLESGEDLIIELGNLDDEDNPILLNISCQVGANASGSLLIDLVSGYFLRGVGAPDDIYVLDSDALSSCIVDINE
jgi:hypothetical protein